MKSINLLVYSLFLFFSFSCNQTEQNKPAAKQTPSVSFKEIEGFLKSADIAKPELLFFYEEKFRSPMPNVYCFNGNGEQVATPPGCFGIIKDYIVYLGDSVIPKKENGQHLEKFLDSIHIMDAYDTRLEFKNLQSGTHPDYYLFVDFMAMNVPGFSHVFGEIVKYVNVSKKKIKLHLVHAISEKNIKYYKKDSATKTTAAPNSPLEK